MTVEESPTRTVFPLSDREEEIMRQIGQGRSNDEIADSIFLSVNTVKTHIRSAYRKLGLSRRVDAVIWAGHHLPAEIIDSEPTHRPDGERRS